MSLCAFPTTMAFRSQETTHDSYTPSVSSSRRSRNGALYRRSSKMTIQSYKGSISNSSTHTTSTAATRKDLIDRSEQGPGGAPSISHLKSFHSLEKPMFRVGNQSQSTVGTIREAGSVRIPTATPTSKQEIRSLNIPFSEDEDEFPLPSAPHPSVYDLPTLPEPSPSSSRIYGVSPPTPLDDPFTKSYGDSQPFATTPKIAVEYHKPPRKSIEEYQQLISNVNTHAAVAASSYKGPFVPSTKEMATSSVYPTPPRLSRANSTYRTDLYTQVPTTRQSSARHHHSNSVPVVSVPSLAQSPPPVQSQMQPPPRPAPWSPTPVRSYLTTQTVGDFQVPRIPFPPGYSMSNAGHQRDVIPSPSQESELNTPSSLATFTNLPIVSDGSLAPVMPTQLLQEPKKKGGFFQGLGLFRSRSSAQKQHPHESKVPDSRAQTTATTTKQACHKSHTLLHYDSDSKVVTKTLRVKTAKPVHAPMSAGTPKPPRSKPIQVPVPAPSFAGVTEETFSSVPNAFASFRVRSKRYRTMSGTSAEAVDGSNADASTVLTSPTNSTRMPTPKLLLPQRDPQQATYAWRNKEEAEALQRGNARRRQRPGVHFEGYEDHPQAERHTYKYAIRARKVRD